jgi:hypothetical protein
MRLRPNGDLLAAGSVVEAADSLAGDAMLVGGDVTFRGVTAGSYLGAGGTQHVAGRIAGSARVTGGTVTLDATVGRNVTLAGGRVVLAWAAIVEHNAYLAGGAVEIDGTVAGDVYAGAGDVVVNGRVEGDLRVEARTLRLGPEAYVGGELRYRTEGEAASIDPGARVVGEIETLPPRPDRRGPVGLYAFRFLAFMATGLAVLALFPGAAARTVSDLKRSPAAAFGTGLLWVILAPLGFLVALATVVGAPVAIMFAAACIAAMYLAPVVPAVWLGEVLRPATEGSDRRAVVVAFLIGGAILGIAMLLPWIGFLLRVAFGLIGVGAMVMAIGTRLGRTSRPAVAPDARVGH